MHTLSHTHVQPSLNSRWPPPQGSKEGGSGRGWEMREISTLLNDQGITPYKGRHSVSFQSCLLATDLVSIIAHTYTLIHTHIIHLHIFSCSSHLSASPWSLSSHSAGACPSWRCVCGEEGLKSLSLSHEHTHTQMHT